MFDALFMTIGVLVLVCALVFGAGDLHGSYQCNNYEKLTGNRTKWMTLDTCYVDVDGRWQRWDEFKARHAASHSGISN